MAKRKLSPIIQAIALYNSLDDRDKATLGEYIKSQTVSTRAPKSTTAPAARGQSRRSKSTDTPPASTGTAGAGVTPATKPEGANLCADCGEFEDYFIHSAENEKGHKFKVAKAKVAGA